VFQTTGCENLKKCLTSYKKMMTSIINSKKPIKEKKQKKSKKKEAEDNDTEEEKEPEPQGYSINTIKQTIQSILFVGTQYMNDFKYLFSDKQAKIRKKYFDTEFQRYKELSKLELQEKKDNTTYPSFDEYLSKVKEKYGENSKQYLVSYLYSVFTVRDNLKQMTIIDKIKDDNEKDNFLLINRTRMMFIVNDFKTKKKYERLEFNVTDNKLKQMIKDYNDDPKVIKTRKQYKNNYFLGKTALSTFVSDINKELGYAGLGGINIYRHMRVTDHYNGDVNNLSFEARKKLSDSMGHTLTTQKTYERNLKVSDSKKKLNKSDDD
jgi:hypothetical protein